MYSKFCELLNNLSARRKIAKNKLLYAIGAKPSHPYAWEKNKIQPKLDFAVGLAFQDFSNQGSEKETWGHILQAWLDAAKHTVPKGSTAETLYQDYLNKFSKPASAFEKLREHVSEKILSQECDSSTLRTLAAMARGFEKTTGESPSLKQVIMWFEAYLQDQVEGP